MISYCNKLQILFSKKCFCFKICFCGYFVMGAALNIHLKIEINLFYFSNVCEEVTRNTAGCERKLHS
jgi:hypothetical protein